MHRFLISLALCVAGIGAFASGPAPHHPDSLQHHQLAAAISADVAAIRSGTPTGPAVWLDGSAPSLRGVPRRSGDGLLRIEGVDASSAAAAACIARSAEASEYLSANALARAGRLAFHTTAPPPFRLV